MAEILVRAIDTTHWDPVKDQRGCFKRGYPVMVKPDGFPWGSGEGLPDFYLLKIPGVSVARVEQFAYCSTEPSIIDPLLLVRVRQWKFLVDTLPPAAIAKLDSVGALVIGPGGDYTRAQLRAFLLDQKSGLIETRTL